MILEDCQITIYCYAYSTNSCCFSHSAYYWLPTRKTTFLHDVLLSFDSKDLPNKLMNTTYYSRNICYVLLLCRTGSTTGAAQTAELLSKRTFCINVPGAIQSRRG